MQPQPGTQPRMMGKHPDTHPFAAQLDAHDSPKLSRTYSPLVSTNCHVFLPFVTEPVSRELSCFFHGTPFYIFRRLPDDKNKREDRGGTTIQTMT